MYIQRHDLTSLLVIPYGRLGNNFFQLLNAFLFAKVLGILVIFVRPGFMGIQSRITTMSQLSVYPILNRSCMASSCFNEGRLFYFKYPCFDDRDRLFMFSELRPALLTGFPIPPSLKNDNTSLVVLLRGGDIMRERPHFFYGQPPCQYYLEVMAQYKSTMLLTDGGNPCELRVRSAGALRIPTNTLVNFAWMVYAHSLVLARSTFGYAAMWVSPIRKRFWTFNMPRFGIFGSYQNCVPTPDYMEILINWTASPHQKRLIETGSCRFKNINAVV